MRESIITKKIMSMMFGVLLIGGVAVLVKAYTGTKEIEHSFESVVPDDDADIFI